jgi:hypothetical protein
MAMAPRLNCLRLEREVEHLTRLLEYQRRAGKRQSTPFSKGPPKMKPMRHRCPTRVADALRWFLPVALARVGPKHRRLLRSHRSGCRPPDLGKLSFIDDKQHDG